MHHIYIHHIGAGKIVLEVQSDTVVPQQSIKNAKKIHAIYISQEKPQKTAEFIGCYDESIIIAIVMSSCITQKINIVRSKLEEKQDEMNRGKRNKAGQLLLIKETNVVYITSKKDVLHCERNSRN